MYINLIIQVKADQICLVPLFGSEHRCAKYQVLSVLPGVKLHWVQASEGNVPPNALQG